MRIFFGRKKVQINNNVIKLSTKTESNVDGFKVVEINVIDPTENLYAVVTPVKMK